MTKKHLIITLVLVFALVLLCGTTALAADSLKVSMELSNKKFTGPEEITVSISVSNVGESDMPGPVTLYYPSGKKVEEFGAPKLAVGHSKNWSGTWMVTQEELQAGKITFQLRYSLYDYDGNLVNKKKNFSRNITYSGADPVLEVNRTFKPSIAQKGQEVSVVYEITNTGAVDVTNVTIKENSAISSKSGTIDSLAVGETKSYTFTATMGTKDLTSSATVSCKAGGKTFTQKVDAATVKYGEVKLSANLSADKKGGAPGDTIKLTLKLKNSGNVDFSNVSVTDPALGTVFSDVTVPKGETLVLEKEVTIQESMDLQFTVNAEDATGEPLETASGRVNVIAVDPTQQIVLRVETEADREEVYEIPGTVRFKVTVYNDSVVEVKNITVKAVDVSLYTFDSIPAGGSATFTRDMAISMPGSFQFTANCKDVLGQSLSFASNAIPIRQTSVTPAPTKEPVPTPVVPSYERIPTEEDIQAPEWMIKLDGIAEYAKYAFAGLAGLLLVLLLIGAVRRAVAKGHSQKAMDHLQGANYRDYSTAVKPKNRSEISGNEVNEPDVSVPEEDGTAQDSELMAETLKRLYEEKAGEKAETAGELTEEITEAAAEETAAAAEEAIETVAAAEEAVNEAAETADAKTAEPATTPEIESAARAAMDARKRRTRK